MGKGKRLRTKDTGSVAIDYWHGGAAGRAIGDMLVPGIQVAGYRDTVLASMSESTLADYRPEFTYITTDRDLAFDFAVLHQKSGLGASALYKVSPLGSVTHDPDFPAGVSFRVGGAKVLTIEPDEFTPLTRESGASLGYTTWDDGSPMYDSNGFPLPNKMQRYFGIQPEDLRPLGFAAEFHAIHGRCMTLIKEKNPGGISPTEFARAKAR
ncbi:hypothetical protein ANMWB30_23420 [Arthrobacter sp. MWB30]|nr:hypothetical protein ANMWB30_23420 [Arthrobacter sp. MWB30]